MQAFVDVVVANSIRDGVRSLLASCGMTVCVCVCLCVCARARLCVCVCFCFQVCHMPNCQPHTAAALPLVQVSEACAPTFSCSTSCATAQATISCLLTSLPLPRRCAACSCCHQPLCFASACVSLPRPNSRTHKRTPLADSLLYFFFFHNPGSVGIAKNVDSQLFGC